MAELKDYSNKKRFKLVVPDACKETTDKSPEGVEFVVPAKFKGHVILRKPDFDGRLAIVESLGLKVVDGQVDVEEAGISTIRKMVAASKEFYEKVEIERISDGEKFASFEDLSYDEDCTGIMVDVATSLVSGAQLSGN